MVGTLVSSWDGLFSGAMLVSGRVSDMLSQAPGSGHPARMGPSCQNRRFLTGVRPLLGGFKHVFLFTPVWGRFLF